MRASEICERIIKSGQRRGVNEIEVYLESSRSQRIKIFHGKAEFVSTSKTLGTGIRVFVNKALGYAFTTELDDRSLEECLNAAISNARATVPDLHNALPEVEKSPSLDIYRESLAQTSTETKIDLALSLEQLAFDYSPKVKEVDLLIYSDGITEVTIANSKGFYGHYKRSDCFVYLHVLAQQNSDISSASAYTVGRDLSDLSVKKTAEEAASKAIMLLGAQPVRTAVVPVLLDPEVAAEVIGVIAGALSAEAVQKRRSLFADKLGQQIAANLVHIVDDGTLPEGLGSNPFDDEGVPKGKTPVIDSGVLSTFLHNTYTARKAGCRSTGNASRPSFRGVPEVSISNFVVLPSTTERKNLLESIQEGFLVMEVQGVHSGANPISGEFSVGAKGMWIKNGQVSMPVKEVTIASDILSILKDIDGVASDLRLFPVGGSVGSPTLLLRKMTVAGK